MIATLLLVSASVLTLADAESNARDHLPALHQATAQTAAQKAVRDETASAYMPQVSGSASDSIQTFTVPGLSGSSIVAGNDLHAGVSATQLLYDFNQTTGKIQANDALAAAQEANERAVWNNALLTVRSAYFVSQEELALAGVAQESLNDQDKHVAQMSAFVAAGTHAPIDLAQARQARAAAQFQLVSAKGAYVLGRANLQQAMGIDSPPNFDVSRDLFPVVPGEDSTTDALLPEAAGARPEIANLEQQAKSQQLIITVNGAGWLPTLSANGSAGADLVSPFGAKAGTTLSPTLRVGVGLAWPFYQGGFTSAAVRQAEAVLANLQAQLDGSRQQVRNDVDSARVAIETAKEQLASAEEALLYAREQLKLAEGQYEQGVGIALAVFDAETAVATSGGQVAQSQASLATARAQLIRALGRAKY